MGAETYNQQTRIEKEEHVFNELLRSNLLNKDELNIAKGYLFRVKNGHWPPKDWEGYD